MASARRPKIRILWSLAAMIAGAMLPRPALASLGAGVSASPIVLGHPAEPGHSYQLPSLVVIDTGTEASYYQVRVGPLGKSAGLAVPAAWISFGRNHFLLQPKESLAVPMTLSVPAGAAPGDYRSYLVAGTVPATPGSGVLVGAAAATRLEFTVVPPGGFSIPWPWPGWVYLVLLGILVVVGGALLQRRLGLAVQIERRR